MPMESRCDPARSTGVVLNVDRTRGTCFYQPEWSCLDSKHYALPTCQLSQFPLGAQRTHF